MLIYLLVVLRIYLCIYLIILEVIVLLEKRVLEILKAKKPDQKSFTVCLCDFQKEYRKVSPRFIEFQEYPNLKNKNEFIKIGRDLMDSYNL